MAKLQIIQLPALSDNYMYLLRDEESGKTAVVDPSEAASVKKALAAKKWKLDFIINTHHHFDHTGGNDELKRDTGCKLVGFHGDSHRISGIDITVNEGDVFTLGGREGKIIEVPGHTMGHIAVWFREDRALFCGDALFTLGCGRIFEGTHKQMWESLYKLRQLPDDTQVYCAHEYTLSNAQFAVTVDPENKGLIERYGRIKALAARGVPTVPATLAEEKLTNPFLRPEDPDLQKHLGMVGVEPANVFAEIRRRKDRF